MIDYVLILNTPAFLYVPTELKDLVLLQYEFLTEAETALSNDDQDYYNWASSLAQQIGLHIDVIMMALLWPGLEEETPEESEHLLPWLREAIALV